MTMYKQDGSLSHQMSRFVFRHLTLKKTLRRLYTEYILEIRTIIINVNPLITTALDGSMELL